MSKKMKVHFSSKAMDWATPQELFDRISDVWGPFDLDPCCSDKTAKAPFFFTKAENGLNQIWHPAKVFMNPPYGNELKHWMKKSYDESRRGAIVVCLVPARTDTRWWYEYCTKASEIVFLVGRVKFESSDQRKTYSAPFPSCLVIFRNDGKALKVSWKKPGEL